MAKQTRVTKCWLFLKRAAFYGMVLLRFGVCAAPIGIKAAVPPEPAISIVSDRKDVVLQFAAQELQRYLRRITNEAIEIGSSRARHHIYVGVTPPNMPGSLR